MITASHYVIKNISVVLETKDLIDAREVFEKFSTRYSADRELQEIWDEFREYLQSMEDEKLDNIKSTLEKLKNIRRLETSGGTDIWFTGTRPGIAQLVKVT